MTQFAEQRDRRRVELETRVDVGRAEKQEQRENVRPKDREPDTKETAEHRCRHLPDTKHQNGNATAAPLHHPKQDERVLNRPVPGRTQDPERSQVSRDPVRSEASARDRGERPVSLPKATGELSTRNDNVTSVRKDAEPVRESKREEKILHQSPELKVVPEMTAPPLEKNSPASTSPLSAVIETRPTAPAQSVTQFVTEEMFKRSPEVLSAPHAEVANAVQRSPEEQPRIERVAEAREATPQPNVHEVSRTREEGRIEVAHRAHEHSQAVSRHKKVAVRTKEQSRLEKVKSRFCRRTRLTMRPKRKGILGLLSRLLGGGQSDPSGRR